MFKVNELLFNELCKSKRLMNKLDGRKNTNYYNSLVIGKLFEKKSIFTLDKADISAVYDEIFSTVKFVNPFENEVNKDILTKKLLRYQEWEKKTSSSSFKVSRKNGITSVKILGNTIAVNYHYILESDSTVEVCYIKNKKCNLSKSGRKNTTSLNRSIQLYLLQKVGEKLYPGKKVYGKIVFLSCLDDKSGEIVGIFEPKEFRNVSIMSFDSSINADFDKRIDDIINLRNEDECTNTDCKSCPMDNICHYKKYKCTLKKISASSKAPKVVTFTDAQQQYIDIKKGNYRILAGAGSGKTTATSKHIIELIKDGISPKEILLITYTTKGAKELFDKISYWCTREHLSVDMNDFRIYTFNAFGYEIIKKEYKRLGFTAKPQVIDKLEQTEIISKIVSAMPRMKGFNYEYPFLNLFNAKGVVIKVEEIIDTMKAKGLKYPSELSAEFNITDDISMELLKINKQYNDYLKTNNLLEFNDQLILLYQLFCDKKLVEKYSFEHIIVDEFQDTDMIQLSILQKMSESKYCISVCVCGDESQSIFSWRGANFENIIDFDKSFYNVHDILLEDNFRSTNEICNFANNINKRNELKTKKKIITHKSGDAPELLNRTIKEIVVQIKNEIASGTPANNIAIISRTKDSLEQIQKALGNIPSIMSTSELIIDDCDVKNILDFANFLEDNTNMLGFAELLQVIKNEEFNKYYGTDDFIDYVNNQKDIFMSKYLSFTDDTKKIDFIYSMFDTVSNDNAAVKKLIDLCKGKKITTVKDFTDFLNKIKLYKADYYIDKDENCYDAVTLTTAHSSKGREFNHVYVYLDKFKYPAIKPKETIFDLEEERRLFYVAITRAKEKLTMFYSKSSYLVTEIKECL